MAPLNPHYSNTNAPQPLIQNEPHTNAWDDSSNGRSPQVTAVDSLAYLEEHDLEEMSGTQQPYSAEQSHFQTALNDDNLEFFDNFPTPPGVANQQAYDQQYQGQYNQQASYDQQNPEQYHQDAYYYNNQHQEQYYDQQQQQYPEPLTNPVTIISQTKNGHQYESIDYNQQYTEPYNDKFEVADPPYISYNRNDIPTTTNGKKRRLFILIGAGILILAIILGLVFGLKSKNGGNKSSSNDGNNIPIIPSSPSSSSQGSTGSVSITASLPPLPSITTSSIGPSQTSSNTQPTTDDNQTPSPTAATTQDPVPTQSPSKTAPPPSTTTDSSGNCFDNCNAKRTVCGNTCDNNQNTCEGKCASFDISCLSNCGNIWIQCHGTCNADTCGCFN